MPPMRRLEPAATTTASAKGLGDMPLWCPALATRVEPRRARVWRRDPGPVRSRRTVWAKTIRPATVWSTRVTTTSISRWRWLPPPSTTIIVPSSRNADALAGLLALLDDLDAHLLAGQEGGLHRVRQLVEVHDAHALELGDPVEVVVGGQDRGAAGPRQGDQLGVHGLDLGRVLVGQLEVDAVVLLEHREHLEAAPAATPAVGLGVVGDVLELAEDEARHDQRAPQEPRRDDVHEPAIDDGARVEVGDQALLGLAVAGGRGVAADRPGRRRGAPASRSSRLATVRPIMPRPRTSDTPSGSSQPYGSGKLASGRPSSRPISRPDQQAQDGRHELAGGHGP